jgi:AcrR family transcriptional regulator
MARQVPDGRLEQLVDAATAVFIERGYARTQMADVAAALGLAKGTLYLYVESKEALFDLAVRYADAPRPLAERPALPIATPAPGDTLRYVRERLAREQVPEALASALARARVRDVRGELLAIVRELYDLLAANRRAIKLVDRSARDLPDLAGLWFDGARHGLVSLLARWVEDRTRRKLLRPLPDPTVTARMVVETIAFWAVHRHTDPHPQKVEDAVAKETVVRFVLGALTED